MSGFESLYRCQDRFERPVFSFCFVWMIRFIRFIRVIRVIGHRRKGDAMRLYDTLLALNDGGRVPFHMPGHARSGAFDYLGGLERIDFTEIDGLDNLHAAEGILKEAMDHAARVWGADRLFFSVGGSTAGMLAAVRALCRGGKPLLLARNAHRSAYHAALLNRSPLRYISPRLHPLGFALDVTPGDVEEALLVHPDTGAVALTSPTYDGVVSDIRSIAEVCHRHGVPLLVDAAHGAHLGFLDPAVPSPVSCGADVTVMSLHKTLPALTQTAAVAVTGSLVDPDEAAAALAIFETSSPSFPLMASADGCAYRMEDPALFAAWREQIGRIREALGSLLFVPEDVFAFDRSKLILRGPSMSGGELAARLRACGIEPEMTAPDYVLLMTTAGTTAAHADALIRALASLPRPGSRSFPDAAVSQIPEAVLDPWDAVDGPFEDVPAEAAEGRLSADFITPYPPGIPLAVPGERINRDVLTALERYRSRGCAVLTGRGAMKGSLRVVKEGKR